MNEKITSKIGVPQGRNVFLVNGEPVSYAAYCDTMLKDEAFWIRRMKDFTESGVKLFILQPNEDDTAWEYGLEHETGTKKVSVPLCRQAEILLGLVPDARFFVRFNNYHTAEWVKGHIGHMQKASKEGADYNGYVAFKWYDDISYMAQSSLASAAALEEQCARYERVIKYCESMAWAERVIGYQLIPNGEGTNVLNLAGNFYDSSEVMQEAFRAWARENYKDEETLRRAWGDRAITFDMVRVPTDDEWRSGRRSSMHWPDGPDFRKMRDYLLLQRELYINWYTTVIRKVKAVTSPRPVIFGIDMGKQTLMGWQHNLAFFGYGPGPEYPNIIAASGAIGVGKIFDEPGLDMLVTPGDYTARTVGYSWESEGSADSMRIRGKAIFVENDSRTFNKDQEDHTLGTFRTPEDLRAGLLRNAAWSLTRGQMDYWAIAGGKYFHNQEVQEKGIRAVKPLSDISPSLPFIETEHAIAMIIDDTSPLYEDGTSGYQNLAVIWQRVIGLAHCGIPYRVHLFSDLEKENMPDYRCYLFPNLFMMDEERLRILNKKVFRDGRMAIFGPSTGITDGERLSGEWAGRVLGVKMRLLDMESPRRVMVNGNHPIIRSFPSSMVYGDSLLYGPILIPENGGVEESGGVVLGEATSFWGVNGPGLFVKDFDGKYKVAWSMAVPLPANLLREMARFGGCHVWSEEDDVVLACGNIAALHTAKAGRKTLKLPAESCVWDLITREKIGERLSEITFDMSAPETRIFYLGDSF